MIAQSVIELIGSTPLVRIDSKDATILAKAEFLNPGGSVKDRIAYAMIKDALDRGLINKESIIIEPTSGNTGVGLAMVCARFGIKLVLTMPSSMSIERQKLVKAYGAEVVLTDPTLGMKGAIDECDRIAKENPNSFLTKQFSNPANPEIHSKTTALEILEDVVPDLFVAGFGTGGTISGVGKVLKEKNPNIQIIAVEPASSPLLSRGEAGAHKIQGIGANFVPENLDRSVVDEFFVVEDDDAFSVARDLARKEGLLVGISSGANVYAARELAKRAKNSGKTIVTVLCDTGERYLSTSLFD